MWTEAANRDALRDRSKTRRFVIQPGLVRQRLGRLQSREGGAARPGRMIAFALKGLETTQGSFQCSRELTHLADHFVGFTRRGNSLARDFASVGDALEIELTSLPIVAMYFTSTSCAGARRDCRPFRLTIRAW
jgi:hypothetical protein